MGYAEAQILHVCLLTFLIAPEEHMPGRLENKVALITGAGGGIGRAAARAFSREGARVVVVDAVEAAGRATVDDVNTAGGTAAFVRADVTRAADVEAMIAFAERAFGAVHVLFNNAGIFPDDDGSVVDTDEAVFDRVIAVNLKGVFLGCKYGIPALLRAGGGSIINTASFVAVMGAATSQSAYTASKGGVLALTREIAIEFARRGIRANALCPGPVNTPLLQSLLADPARRARRMVHLPMGRLAEAEEIAAAALYLASDESSYVNGTTFLVDGGTTGAYVTPE
jgi:NAD(P)-dependent dehydrogenase (short-subunit alcohol dehydrogenase family)